MDKELLRVVIILIGVLVMIGMVLWHFVKSLRERRTPDDYYDEDSYDDRVVDEFSVEEDDDEMGVFALGSELVDGDALLDDQAIKPSPKSPADVSRKDMEKKQAATLANSRRLELPALIEFSIVARADQGFNGEDLFEAFERVGLRYGSVRVFERVDANRMVDFSTNKTSTTLANCSYIPGLAAHNLENVLPHFIRKNLQDAFVVFGKKMKGYYTNEAQVVATESRTSSPVRIPRDTATLAHPAISNLYPCGEGAGYAGGIVSAAMDGERVIDAIFLKHAKSHL
jgi:hypothetical protein